DLGPWQREALRIGGCGTRWSSTDGEGCFSRRDGSRKPIDHLGGRVGHTRDRRIARVPKDRAFVWRASGRSAFRGRVRRTDPKTGLRVHGNTAESVNAGLKASIRSVSHHISPKHLSRYLAEIAYRWNRRGAGARGRLRNLLAGMAAGPLTFAECVR